MYTNTYYLCRENWYIAIWDAYFDDKNKRTNLDLSKPPTLFYKILMHHKTPKNRVSNSIIAASQNWKKRGGKHVLLDKTFSMDHVLSFDMEIRSVDLQPTTVCYENGFLLENVFVCCKWQKYTSWDLLVTCKVMQATSQSAPPNYYPIMMLSSHCLSVCPCQLL